MIRFGVIGTNFITDWFIYGGSLHKDFKVTAVYSRTYDKGKAFANKHSIENVFTDLNAMANSDLIDAVYIASPNSLHMSQAVLFLKNKKHVLCEKPIASNSKELKTMIEAAKDNNVLLMEALKSSFLPNFKAIEDNIYKIGKIRRYFASFCQYSSRYDKYKEGTILNAFNPEFSNGALMDIGIYCIYPMLKLFGKPQSLKATGILLDSGVDGEGCVLANYEDMDGIIMYSKIANSYLPCEIQGENGSIIIDSISNIKSVKIHYKNGDIEDISRHQVDKNMFYEIDEFISLINTSKNESAINSMSLSLIVSEVMEEVRKDIGLKFPADLK